MGYIIKEFIDAPSVYACLECRSHLARRDDVISRTFQGRFGRAYLTETVVNQKLGKNEDRLLMTGLHTVCDLHCRVCDAVVGWRYVRAHDRSQQYKEGRYILEQSRIYSIDQPIKPGPNDGLSSSAVSCEVTADMQSPLQNITL
ncbi:hypothetical protein H4R99_002046 [Coemansia sp. RSA 1722]|nr:hypothetical protein LPJ57_004713 [Coemansia sp. RSA 486]KAJ2595912.1 hypothetical protein GGF39_003655 [Coemansia sp. RSA 1721]KAJ2604061.1 hypothetical protein H4R99_002046 [Coemansia sp. RSA 1722]KAJ2638095.1 hypothetical protein GGF40_001907 [Coemansia sp. RSA 1286]